MEERFKTLSLIKEGMDNARLAVFDGISLFNDTKYDRTSSILRNIAANLTSLIIESGFDYLDLASLKQLSLIMIRLRDLIPADETVLDEATSSRFIRFFIDRLHEKCDWQILILCINIVLDVCQSDFDIYCCLCDIFMENLWCSFEFQSSEGLKLLWRFNQLIPSEVDLLVSRKLSAAVNVPKFIHLWKKTSNLLQVFNLIYV